MDTTSLITITIVSGILLSLNPVSISIFTALLAGSLGKGRAKTQLHTIAVTYLLSLFVLYGIGGALIASWLSSVSQYTLLNIGLFIGLINIAWGLVYIKNFFWYGNKSDTPKHLTKILHVRTVKKNNPANSAQLALTATYATIPSVGIPMMAYATIMTIARPNESAWMLLLALILVLPLLAIFILTLRKLKLSAVLKWKQDSKAIFWLCIGLTCVVFSWLLFLLINGTLEPMS